MAETNNNAQDMNFKSREDRLKELTDQLEVGVKSVRNSAEFKTLLATMAKFPHYSLNNCILISMQKPDATLCQSYGAWKKMGRYVKKGEKGIKVIAPAPYTIEKEVDKLDANGKVVLDKDGEPVKVKQELNLMGFKAESTFDVSQTEGKELPKLGIDELKGDVNKFSLLMNVIREVSPVPIGYEDITTGAKGYYHVEEKRIAIQKDMSELQTLKTCLHEVVHAKLHSDADSSISKNRKEIEAEGTAAVVLNFFGYDTGAYSFPYLASYTTDESMKELKAALNTIRATSATIIRAVEDKMLDKEKPQEMSPEQEAELEKYAAEQREQEQSGANEKVQGNLQKQSDDSSRAVGDQNHSDDDWPLKDDEGVVADKSAAVTNTGRKILGTVRILPDGAGGKRPSLLDKLKIEKERLSREKAATGAANEKGVAI
ncbi:MAG: hypothetical protein IJJ64_03795 [Butyrivibrio sp.]|nr:hypothetical protein [Butyrivibrio sp.]